MKEEFTISVFTEDRVCLLTRIAMSFTRRHIQIESITASKSQIEGLYCYIIVVEEEEMRIKKLVQQLEKQIDVVKATYQRNDQIIFQEVSLYRVSTSALAESREVEQIIGGHSAYILTAEPGYTVIAKTGQTEDLQKLYDQLKPYGVQCFVRSGRVLISKEVMTEEETASKTNF